MADRICVVGSLALDTIQTPSGSASEVLGGSCSYFAVAASFFAPVNLVGVVGTDFPAEERAFLASCGINLDGLSTVDGPTFRWTGRYHENMNVRDTLDLQLNVFGEFSPKLPASYRDTEMVFLANISPRLQTGVLSQPTHSKYIGADSLGYLSERGLIPLSPEQRESVREAAENGDKNVKYYGS